MHTVDLERMVQAAKKKVDYPANLSAWLSGSFHLSGSLFGLWDYVNL